MFSFDIQIITVLPQLLITKAISGFISFEFFINCCLYVSTAYQRNEHFKCLQNFKSILFIKLCINSIIVQRIRSKLKNIKSVKGNNFVLHKEVFTFKLNMKLSYVVHAHEHRTKFRGSKRKQRQVVWWGKWYGTTVTNVILILRTEIQF